MSKRILVIDDESGIVKVLEKRLKDHNFDVDIAFNGKDGLDKIYQSAPDLIILDIMMPGMGGNEIAAKLKQNKSTAKIPIIFLSALQSKEDEQKQGSIVGGNIILAKPYDINILVAKINEMIL